MKVHSQNPALQTTNQPRGERPGPSRDNHRRPLSQDAFESAKPQLTHDATPQQKSDPVGFEFPKLREILALVSSGEMTMLEVIRELLGSSIGTEAPGPSDELSRQDPPVIDPDYDGPEADVDDSNLPELRSTTLPRTDGKDTRYGTPIIDAGVARAGALPSSTGATGEGNGEGNHELFPEEAPR